MPHKQIECFSYFANDNAMGALLFEEEKHMNKFRSRTPLQHFMAPYLVCYSYTHTSRERKNTKLLVWSFALLVIKVVPLQNYHIYLRAIDYKLHVCRIGDMHKNNHPTGNKNIQPSKIKSANKTESTRKNKLPLINSGRRIQISTITISFVICESQLQCLYVCECVCVYCVCVFILMRLNFICFTAHINFRFQSLAGALK